MRNDPERCARCSYMRACVCSYGRSFRIVSDFEFALVRGGESDSVPEPAAGFRVAFVGEAERGEVVGECLLRDGLFAVGGTPCRVRGVELRGADVVVVVELAGVVDELLDDVLFGAVGVGCGAYCGGVSEAGGLPVGAAGYCR